MLFYFISHKKIIEPGEYPFQTGPGKHPCRAHRQCDRRGALPLDHLLAETARLECKNINCIGCTYINKYRLSPGFGRRMSPRFDRREREAHVTRHRSLGTGSACHLEWVDGNGKRTSPKLDLREREAQVTDIQSVGSGSAWRNWRLL